LNQVGQMRLSQCNWKGIKIVIGNW
jgi:hypothetical protein